jgi:hypothetical protein
VLGEMLLVTVPAFAISDRQRIETAVTTKNKNLPPPNLALFVVYCDDMFTTYY